MKRIAAVLTALCILVCSSAAFALADKAQVGTNVGAFSSFDLDGNSVDGSVFSANRASVVCYFATWSDDCIEQLSILQTLFDENSGFGVFGLLCEDATSTPEAALEIMNGEGYTFPVLICDDVWQGLVEQAMFVPQFFIVSRTGVVVEVWHAAFQSPDILRERLAFWGKTEFADGDVDENGAVDMADALLVMRCAMGLYSPTQDIITHGDMNGNGSLDIDDSLRILRMVMGLRGTLYEGIN